MVARSLHTGLQIDNPEQYNFRPKWLLVQICTVYLNMSAADRAGVFAAAIAADKRSYRPEMFAEASMILRQLGLMPELQVRMGVCKHVAVGVAIQGVIFPVWNLLLLICCNMLLVAETPQNLTSSQTSAGALEQRSIGCQG